MDFGKNITIRRLFENERPAALDLAWRVFSEYESPDYSRREQRSFRSACMTKNTCMVCSITALLTA